MNPIEFDEQTTILKKPEGMSDEDCAELPIWTDGEYCVSCWNTSFWSRLKFLFTGQAWLFIMGNVQPPVSITFTHPFKIGSKK